MLPKLFIHLCKIDIDTFINFTIMLSQINELVNANKERLEWDDYFMSIALIASQRSPCERLKVGSVIVKDGRIISMGYN
jgi:hypothetical protein